MEFELKEKKVSVPRSAGITGFLRTIETILKLERLQEVLINAKGEINYSRYAPASSEDDPEIFFNELQPWASIRQVPMEEIFPQDSNAAVIILQLIDHAVSSELKPTALVVSTESIFWEWYEKTTGSKLRNKSTVCSLPLFADSNLPSTALVLCAAYEASADVVSTHKIFKVEMEMFLPPEVDIL